MEQQNISLVVFCFLFGAIVGLSGLLTTHFILESSEASATQINPSQSGMDVLNEYRCRQSETKEIILGGKEDYYSPEGDEPNALNVELQKFRTSLNGGQDDLKGYDNTDNDKFFSDQFVLSSRTFHGIFVMRMQETSNIRNDSLSIGYKGPNFFNNPQSILGYGDWTANLEEESYWIIDNDLYVANLSKLPANKSNPGESLLDIIRETREDNDRLFVNIADDTNVDFIGFAVCLEPEQKRGTVFADHNYADNSLTPKLPDDIMNLFSAKIDDTVCTIQGCLSCEAKRPVACINDNNTTLPDNFPEDIQTVWSGGNIAFTTPVAGSNFSTEDDVNAFCATEFGTNWRILSKHDGDWRGVMAGRGKFPADQPNVWITIKDQPHANCWKLRPDYETTPIETTAK